MVVSKGRTLAPFPEMILYYHNLNTNQEARCPDGRGWASGAPGRTLLLVEASAGPVWTSGVGLESGWESRGVVPADGAGRWGLVLAG